MYPVRNIVVSDVDFVGVIDFDSQWHPLSYYVRGGLDISGTQLSLNNPVEYDGEMSENPDVYNSSDVGQPFYDPRISGFDVAERLGVDSYNAAQDELARPSDKPDDKTE